ncbi:MAG: hypothetical protein N2201_01735 [candidate division WOR-3 bacterium]|nr:hypothetical protein [candidate division WOR-3 bacterium]
MTDNFNNNKKENTPNGREKKLNKILYAILKSIIKSAKETLTVRIRIRELTEKIRNIFNKFNLFIQ